MHAGRGWLTLDVMWRALVLLTVVAVGCGGVSDEGVTDENGCPARPEDWSGTATFSSGCDGAPQTMDIEGGAGLDSCTGKPCVMPNGVDPSTGMCVAVVGVSVACGRAAYVLKIPPR